MAPSLAQLRALLAVVDRGSFSAAAALLGVSQPAVSAAIRQLEDVVEGRVVNRQTAQPTSLGLVVLPYAQTAVDAMARLATAVAGHHRAPHGVIRLAVVATVRAAVVPSLTRAWTTELPGVVVEVLEGDDGELADWLEGGLADLAVLVDPDAEDTDEQAVRLPGDAMCAALPAGHPLLGSGATADAVALKELVRHGLINSTGCETQMRALHQTSGLPFRPIAEVNGLPALLTVIGAGSGVSIVPAYARALLPDGVVLIPLEPTRQRLLVLTGPVSRDRHDLVPALLDVARRTTTGTGLSLRGGRWKD